MTDDNNILTPDYTKGKCIKGNKRCKFLVAKQIEDIEGIMFFVYYCKCEDSECAGCIPTYI